MAAIRKRGNRWQVQIRRKGAAPLAKTFKLFSDAKEWARHQERLADRGELGPDRKELDRITLAELIQRYLDDVIPKKCHGETDTFALKLVLRHSCSKKRLSELSHIDFTGYRDERLKEVSPATLRRQLTPLRHMFRHAHDEWSVPLRDNPLSKVKLAGTDKRRERRVREGELDRLLAAGRKTRNPLLIPIVRLALETAMRRGEILALRFRDVDIERCTATIRESKNGYSRTIPLSSLAVSLLETTIAVMSDKAKAQNGRVFPVSPVAVRLAWDKLTRRAKIDDLHFHDLRHEAISRFFELGLTVPEVASISGHRDIRMLLRYAHADKGKLARKLNAASLSDEDAKDG